jgi:hypothetical protein
MWVVWCILVQEFPYTEFCKLPLHQLVTLQEDSNLFVHVLLRLQASLVLHPGYVPTKHHTNQTQNSHLQQCISWEFGDCQPHPIHCILSTVCAYISIQYIYLSLMQYKCKRLASTVSGTVHSDMTVVFLQHKQTVPVSDCLHLISSKYLPLSLILLALSRIVRTLIWANLTLRHMSTIRSPLSIRLITSNFSSLPICVAEFSLWLH